MAFDFTETGTSSLMPSHLFGTLPVLKLRIRLRTDPEARLPSFLGSAWRGLIGWELRRLVCPLDSVPTCAKCAIREHCPYFLLFEKDSNLPGLSESPRGYILYPPPANGGGDPELHVTLLGSCVKFVPVLVMALIRGQKTGLGTSRLHYRIVSLEEIAPGGTVLPIPLDPESLSCLREGHPLEEWLDGIPESPGNFTVRLATPVRLRKKGVYLSSMDWPFFFESVARRLESISCLYSGGSPMGKDLWQELQRRLENIEGIQARLRWQEYSRYSNRQKSKVPMGGLVGEATMTDAPAWLLPWWRAASLVHVGKGASMGLGKVEVLENGG